MIKWRDVVVDHCIAYTLKIIYKRKEFVVYPMIGVQISIEDLQERYAMYNWNLIAWEHLCIDEEFKSLKIYGIVIRSKILLIEMLDFFHWN